MHKSWGNFPNVTHDSIIDMYWRDQVIDFQQCQKPVLAYGQGRSYGDSGLNENGILISTKHLNRFIAFDVENGTLQCESGVTLADILELIVPHGWFLPVLPGTQFVTVGGAIANDIHGKNHHHAGTFGHHVLSIELLRSDGQAYPCTREENAPFFHATVGGLGLTGMILSATLQLKKIPSLYLEAEYIKFKNLDEFFELDAQSQESFEYNVAWLDCVANGKHFGRGIFMRANHCPHEKVNIHSPFHTKTKKKKLSIPFYFPSFALNSFSIKVFNHFYFHSFDKKSGLQQIPYPSFFFPLDSLHHWNRIYGKKGFLQYQCVIPAAHSEKIQDVLKTIVSRGGGSFLSVLKTFGEAESQGFLSFPMYGVTLALDIPYRGEETLTLLNQLDAIVMAYGGRVYPAKDARMSSSAFKAYFPYWNEFSNYVDPQFSSSFWRRVINDET